MPLSFLSYNQNMYIKAKHEKRYHLMDSPDTCPSHGKLNKHNAYWFGDDPPSSALPCHYCFPELRPDMNIPGFYAGKPSGGIVKTVGIDRQENRRKMTELVKKKREG